MVQTPGGGGHGTSVRLPVAQNVSLRSLVGNQVDAWHGVLEFKESYSKHFYYQRDDQLRNGSYDVSKLTKLIDALIKQAGLVTTVI
jgi:hypothetical protein